LVLFDSNFLTYLLNQNSRPPAHSETGDPVDHAKARVEYLIQCLEKSKERTLIPSPALAEVLVSAGDALEEWLSIINTTSVFEVVDFDQRAAIELAMMEQNAHNQGDKKGGAQGTWAKVKFDRQIIAIAKVHRVAAIYSDDKDVKAWAEKHGIRVARLEDIDPPPELAQRSLPFDANVESD